MRSRRRSARRASGSAATRPIQVCRGPHYDRTDRPTRDFSALNQAKIEQAWLGESRIRRLGTAGPRRIQGGWTQAELVAPSPSVMGWPRGMKACGRLRRATFLVPHPTLLAAGGHNLGRSKRKSQARKAPALAAVLAWAMAALPSVAPAYVGPDSRIESICLRERTVLRAEKVADADHNG